MKDYSESGLDLQYAFLDHAKLYPDKTSRPEFIRWGSLEVRDALRIPCPHQGAFRLRFISARNDFRQGIDVAVSGGIQLRSGKPVEILRTWHDEKYEDEVSYAFRSPDGVLRVWNVCLWEWPGGRKTEEKWTGNAGFWVETRSPSSRVLHCSAGPLEVPDFESLVVELTVLPRTTPSTAP